MAASNGKIRLIIVTTADDVDEEFNRHQPLRVVFNRALREVGGASNRDQFALEYDDVELSDLSRAIGDFVDELGWIDGTRLEFVPKPVVV